MKASKLEPGEFFEFANDASRTRCRRVQQGYQFLASDDLPENIDVTPLNVHGWDDEPGSESALVWRKEPPDKDGIWACGYCNRVTDICIYDPSRVYCYSHYCYLGEVPKVKPTDYDPANCHCEKCRPVTIRDCRFPICPLCGNKRCPHCWDHAYKCTGSNEPKQIPELITPAPLQLPQADAATKLLREIQDAAKLGDDDEYHVPARLIVAIDRLIGQPAPLQLREGAWYRRRDGKIVGPIEPYHPDDERHYRQPWKVWNGEHNDTYYDDGHWNVQREEQPLDLIAEVPPPVEPPEPEQFAPGDLVVCVDDDLDELEFGGGGGDTMSVKPDWKLGLPFVIDYEGGGVLLTKYTTVSNVVRESPLHRVDEIFELLRSGYEVLIANDEVVAIYASQQTSEANRED